jgi:hypothetical protein
VITIGIDPHKSSLTAVAVQPSGEVSATIRLEVNRDTVTRLHALLRDLIPGGAKRNLSAEKAAALLRAVQPVTAVEVEVVGLPQAVRCSMVGPVGWAARVVNQSVRA